MDATLRRLKVRDIPPVPPEVIESFRNHRVTMVPFEERGRVITDP